MQENNIVKYVKVLFAVNAVMAIAVTGLACYVISHSSDNAMIAESGNSVKPKNDQTVKTAVPNVPKIAASRDLEIGVDDNGFKPQGAQADGTQTVKFIISNTGTKEHSFKIDGLNVDSGLIAPGQKKEVFVDSLPDNTKNYSFYSDAGDDSKNVFTGILMVLRKQ